MLKAKTEGLNAIAITGGAKAIPKLFPTFFRDKRVAIAYDNDDAGRSGAKALAS
jgi:DNA primase